MKFDSDALAKRLSPLRAGDFAAHCCHGTGMV